MNPELFNAGIAVFSAVASAVAVWVKMRRGGGAAPNVLPTPTDPTKPIDFPSTGRPGLDLLIRLFLARQAKQEQIKQQEDVRALFAELLAQSDVTPLAK